MYDGRKDDQINIKVRHQDKELFKDAAKIDQKSLTQWLTDLGLARYEEQQHA